MTVGVTAGEGRYDVVVLGSGVAGLSVALGLAGRLRVAVVTPGELGGGSTPWAQGGIAAAIGPGDSARHHAADTITAGAGLCDAASVHTLTREAPERLNALIARGARFDREPTGALALTREGGHHRRRVVHAGGDATGAEVSRTLVAAVRRTSVDVVDHSTATSLRWVETPAGRQVVGVRLRPTNGGVGRVLDARAVVVATGGIGGLYAASTNPADVTGDGLALALRAGASLVDVEFVQFHPTALRVAAPGGQIPLVTEALRGEGAVLRDAAGRRVMAGQHPLADLAPRDVVARRIAEVMAETTGGRPNLVGLDATALGAGLLRDRFPTVLAACLAQGIDPAVEPIPVAPAQHFLCGGIATDRSGSTDVTGLFAAGEAAATGVHGANRLASNSLVEGMVFGRRLAQRLASELPRLSRVNEVHEAAEIALDAGRLATVRATMSRFAGVRRSADGLEAAARRLAAHPAPAGNVELVAGAVVAAALAREESRGCHWREDHAEARESWQRRLVVRLGDDGRPAVAAATSLERTA